MKVMKGLVFLLVLAILANIYSFTVDAQANTVEPYAEAVETVYENEDENEDEVEDFVIPEYLYPLVEWLEDRSVSNIFSVIRFGSSNRLEELQHSVRHEFEQNFLPFIADELEEELLYAINTDDLDLIEALLNHFWDALVDIVILNDLLDSGRIANEEEILQFTPICDECGYPKGGALRRVYGLHFSQHFLSIEIEEVTDDIRILVMEMSEPGILQSTYIGIAYMQNGQSLQVFTLERSMSEGIYAFSAIFRDSRTNLGQMENCRETFIQAISNRVLNN